MRVHKKGDAVHRQHLFFYPLFFEDQRISLPFSPIFIPGDVLQLLVPAQRDLAEGLQRVCFGYLSVKIVLHGYLKTMISEDKYQICSSQGMIGAVNKIRICG